MRYVYGDRPVTWVIGQIERINTPMKYDLHSEDFSLGYFKFEDNVRAIIEGGAILLRGITTSTATERKVNSNWLRRAVPLSASEIQNRVVLGSRLNFLQKLPL